MLFLSPAPRSIRVRGCRQVKGGTYFECGKGIAGDVERGLLHEVEEFVEIRRFQDDFGELLYTDTFTQHHTTIECNIGIFVSRHVG